MMDRNAALAGCKIEPASGTVSFEPFHGFPKGLVIHVVDQGRLNSLGSSSQTVTEDGERLLYVDSVQDKLSAA